MLPNLLDPPTLTTKSKVVKAAFLTETKQQKILLLQNLSMMRIVLDNRYK